MLSVGRSSSSRVGMLASLHVEVAEAYFSELIDPMHSMDCVQGAVCGGCTDTSDPDNKLLSSVEVVHV